MTPARNNSRAEYQIPFHFAGLAGLIVNLFLAVIAHSRGGL